MDSSTISFHHGYMTVVFKNIYVGEMSIDCYVKNPSTDEERLERTGMSDVIKVVDSSSIQVQEIQVINEEEGNPEVQLNSVICRI